MDCGIGSYERIAAQLFPAARVVVEHAAPAAQEHLLDVGCGTGSATLLAAANVLVSVFGVIFVATLARG